MDRLLFSENFGDLEWTGTTSKKADLPSSSLIIPEPLLDASEYYFELDGEIYQITDATNTAQYLTFTYRVDSTSVLYVRLVKNDDFVNITIRPANFPNVNFETSVLKIYEKEQGDKEIKNGLVRFNKWRVVKITYNVDDDDLSCELIKEGEIPQQEKNSIRYAIIRLTHNKVVKIKYDEINDVIEFEEV